MVFADNQKEGTPREPLQTSQRNKLTHRPYSPSRAQRRYEKGRKSCGRRPILAAPEALSLVRRLLREEWSPEQIQHRLRLDGNAVQISCATIYRALQSGLMDGNPSEYMRKCSRYAFHLRRNGKKRKKNGGVRNQGRYAITHCISERPEAAARRLEPGHWEGDTVAGRKGGARFVTMADRKTRFLLAAKVPNGTADEVRDALIGMLGRLPAECVCSVTPDRGHEFAKRAEVSAAVRDVPFHFADPYSPWQRGTNENTNGLLRQYFPKETSFDGVSDDDLASVVDKLNHRPRKYLAWRSPFEVFWNLVLQLT